MFDNHFDFNKTAEDRFSDYMMVGEAADYLGVHKDTLRRWEEKGKLKTYRNPINNYRMYQKSDLTNLLKEVK